MAATDFVLFPPAFRNPRYSMTGIHEQEHLLDPARTSYDAYDSVPSLSTGRCKYSQAPQFSVDSAREQAGDFAHRPTLSASPSSFSQAFDHPSSIMSSTSGASGQSTSSSANGSPYTHAIQQFPYHEQWSKPLHGLGLDPNIVNHDPSRHDLYQANGFDNDVSLNVNKGQCFVGEYQSNFLADSAPNFPATFPPPSDFSSQGRAFDFSASPLALDTSVRPKDVTIDSILEETNSKTKAATQLLSPVSPTSPFSTALSLPFATRSPSEARMSTTSPVAPTSDIPLFCPESALPVRPAERTCGLQHFSRRSITPLSFRQNQFHVSQDSLFGHSSGRFVAPLELSCRSS